MALRSEQHETVPHWLGDTKDPHAPVLDSDTTTDVCVIGAGIAGLSVAYELALRGKSVVVLDRVGIASGETGRSTAQLSNALDTRYFDLERIHGAEGARLVAESHRAAIDRIATIAVREHIECGLQVIDGFLFSAREQPPDILDKELAAAKRAGIERVEIVGAAPLTSFDTGRALRFADQAMIDPVRYCAGLARAIAAHGGRIHTAQAATIEGGGHAAVQTAEGPVVRAQHVVVATNAPVNNLVTLHTKQQALRTYVVTATIPKDSVPAALYWDTADPYHYVRIDPRRRDHDVLIVGGEDHKTGQEDHLEERWIALESWMRVRFPMAGRMGACWSGQIMQSVDGLAYIGKNPMDHHNVLVVTGDSGNGITHGAISGMMLADAITGRESPWAKLYDPARVTLRAGAELIKHNLDAMQQYASWFEGGDVADEDEIAPGHGAVVREGVRLLAVYRDEHGFAHRCSAVCPHLGGIVQYNGAERSWDCPCHGSRFDAYGKVVRGPANVDLLPARDPEPKPAEVSSESELLLLPLTGVVSG